MRRYGKTFRQSFGWATAHFERYFGFRCDSRSRYANFVDARMMFCAVLRKYEGLSLKKIGILCGGRDHSTIVHSMRNHEIRMEGLTAVDRGYIERFNEYVEDIYKHDTILPTFSKENLKDFVFL